jgi:homoserine/homoserine lactone efflux protein
MNGPCAAIMKIETILTFTIVAWLSILTPGPAVLLALRNGASRGLRSVLWSSLGNVTGIFCLSLASMLGLGAVLKSSAIVFGAVKVLGALYLFYLGIRHLFGRNSALKVPLGRPQNRESATACGLFGEAFLLAATNPKPILFFTALFPQFIHPQAPLLPQFLVLTGIFMSLSFATLVCYALIASRAGPLLVRPHFAAWVNRAVGSVLIAFGAAMLSLHRPAR